MQWQESPTLVEQLLMLNSQVSNQYFNSPLHCNWAIHVMYIVPFIVSVRKMKYCIAYGLWKIIYMLHTKCCYKKENWRYYADVRPPKYCKELGLQTSYFWGETIHFFLEISKTIYLFPARRETIYLFEQNGKQFIYFHIFLNPPPPPPPPPQISNGPPLIQDMRQSSTRLDNDILCDRSRCIQTYTCIWYRPTWLIHVYHLSVPNCWCCCF